MALWHYGIGLSGLTPADMCDQALADTCSVTAGCLPTDVGPSGSRSPLEHCSLYASGLQQPRQHWHRPKRGE
jgi:hypothetical protein